MRLTAHGNDTTNVGPHDRRYTRKEPDVPRLPAPDRLRGQGLVVVTKLTLHTA
jgi:hypothetical protein